MRLDVYNTMGQKVRTLVNERKAPGYYTVFWDGRNDHGMQVVTGVYICRIVAGEFMAIKKTILMQ